MPRVRRRRQLLTAAQEIFVARGYHAAAMDEIAERAGVSKPVLYQHFPGKLDLYLALLEEHSEALVEKQRAALESTDDNRERVAASFRAYFDFVSGDGEAFRLVFESDLRNLPAVREKSEHTMQRCAELIGEVIKQDTSISEEQADLLSVGLVGMAETSARYWLNNHGTVPKDAAEQLVARLAWRGISGWDLQRSTEEGGPGKGGPTGGTASEDGTESGDLSAADGSAEDGAPEDGAGEDSDAGKGGASGT